MVGDVGHRPAVVAELLGPSGAGKTSLARILAQHAAVAVATQPDASNIFHAPFFVANTLSLLPVLLDGRCLLNPRLSGADIGTMAIVNGWHQVLQRGAPHRARLIILDQGPAFMLGELYRLNPKILTQPRLERWCRQMCDRWAAEIDLVVWLDADDADLLQRVRTRPLQRSVRDACDREGGRFMASQRLAYGHVISMLAARPHRPLVLRLDTGVEPAEKTAARILAACGVGDEAMSRTPIQPHAEF